MQQEEQHATASVPPSAPVSTEASQMERVVGGERGAAGAEAPEVMRDGIRKRPVIGAALAGGVVLGAATLVGVVETAIGMGAAYVAYRVFKRRRKAQ